MALWKFFSLCLLNCITNYFKRNFIFFLLHFRIFSVSLILHCFDYNACVRYFVCVEYFINSSKFSSYLSQNISFPLLSSFSSYNFIRNYDEVSEFILFMFLNICIISVLLILYWILEHFLNSIFQFNSSGLSCVQCSLAHYLELSFQKQHIFNFHFFLMILFHNNLNIF